MNEPATGKNRLFTYRDYLNWPDNERWEIIDGVPYNMTPAPSANHQRVLGEFFTAFKLYLRGKPCEVFIAPFDVRLPLEQESDEETSTVVQPDLTVVCAPEKIDRRGCKGSPDLVIEITSPSTMHKDMKHKLNRYENAGITEYWIVHPEGKTVVVYRLDTDRRYGRPQIYADGESLPVGIFPDFTLDLKEIFVSITGED